MGLWESLGGTNLMAALGGILMIPSNQQQHWENIFFFQQMKN